MAYRLNKKMIEELFNSDGSFIDGDERITDNDIRVDNPEVKSIPITTDDVVKQARQRIPFQYYGMTATHYTPSTTNA